MTMLALVAMLSACATPGNKGAALLTDADAKLVAEDYRGAIASYQAFIGESPEHPQAARAGATQKALERLAAVQAAAQLTAQTATTRKQQGADVMRKELAEKQAEADKLRAEVAKLRADLERLRSIDLQTPRK